MSSSLSKLLSLVLRHDPAHIGITLDRAGWTDVDALVAAFAAHGKPLTRELLTDIVATSDKQRFAFSDDGSRIRANQGHSVPVELELTAATPPAVLYHGTIKRFVTGIRAHGLIKGVRHHVHLSANAQSAEQAGARRGKPVVLAVRAAEMVAAGHAFFVADNGVWLTDHVPVSFLEFPPDEAAAEEDPNVGIAKATLAACEQGGYDVGGRRVELADAIAQAKAGTVLYTLDTMPSSARHAVTTIEVTNETTVAALFRLAREAGHLACLAFASARNPGGGFLSGAQAKEESLSRASALYPCQLTQPAFYERNRAQKSLLYLDQALWSPRVPFFRDEAGGWLDKLGLASVITCAPPNAAALGRGVSAAELEATLYRRARLVLAIAQHHAVDTLLLGAWGAGVFKNEPAMIARVFHKLLTGEHATGLTRVVFAVTQTPEDSANHRAFADAFAA